MCTCHKSYRVHIIRAKMQRCIIILIRRLFIRLYQACVTHFFGAFAFFFHISAAHQFGT